jgi:hypothetical protein
LLRVRAGKQRPQQQGEIGAEQVREHQIDRALLLRDKNRAKLC